MPRRIRQAQRDRDARLKNHRASDVGEREMVLALPNPDYGVVFLGQFGRERAQDEREHAGVEVGMRREHDYLIDELDRAEQVSRALRRLPAPRSPIRAARANFRAGSIRNRVRARPPPRPHASAAASRPSSSRTRSTVATASTWRTTGPRLRVPAIIRHKKTGKKKARSRRASSRTTLSAMRPRRLRNASAAMPITNSATRREHQRCADDRAESDRGVG